MEQARKWNMKTLFGPARTRVLATELLRGTAEGKLNLDALEALDPGALMTLPEDELGEWGRRGRGRPRSTPTWDADALLIELAEHEAYEVLRRKARSERAFLIEAQRRLKAAGLVDVEPTSRPEDAARQRVKRLQKKRLIGPLRVGTSRG